MWVSERPRVPSRSCCFDDSGGAFLGTASQLKTLSGRYSNLAGEDPQTLDSVVCNIANAPAYNDQGLWAIQNNAGGCPPKP